jgi:membrane fusion protein, heavy metal efflux system
MNKLIIPLFTCFILWGCEEKSENVTATNDSGHALSLNPDQFNQLGVATTELSTDTIFGEMSIQGMITVPPQQKQSISFPVAAKLESLSIQPGQSIQKNQIVAWVSDLSFIQLQEDYLKSLLQTELAEREFVRQQELQAKNATSDKAYQESKNQYLMFNTQRQALVQRLELLGISLPKDGMDIQRKVSIRAEQSGKIVSCNVQPGQYLGAGQEIATIMNIEPLWIDAALYHATDIQQIKSDRVTIKDNQGHEGIGKIIHKGGEISNSDQATHLWISVEQSTGEWIPGMPVDCKLSLDKISVYRTEKDAIVQFANQSQIFVTTDNTHFDMIPVQLIKETGELRYFTTASPLNSDQKIVSKGAYYLLMALKNKGE